MDATLTFGAVTSSAGQVASHHHAAKVRAASIRDLTRSVDIPLVASGGVSSIEDIQALMTLKSSGLIGIIIGKALYTGAINLQEALLLTKDS